MIWRRRVTESSSSATQTSSDHLDRRLLDTRMRPPAKRLSSSRFLGSFTRSVLGNAPASTEQEHSRTVGQPEVTSSLATDLAGHLAVSSAIPAAYPAISLRCQESKHDKSLLKVFSELSGRFRVEKRVKWPVAKVKPILTVHRVVSNPQNTPFFHIWDIQAG